MPGRQKHLEAVLHGSFRSAITAGPVKVNRVPWRKRSKPAKLLPADKARLLERRIKKKAAYVASMEQSLKTVDDEAARLHAEHPEHSKQYHLRALMQKSKVSRTRRQPNIWNAVLHRTCQRMNKDIPAGQPKLNVTDSKVREACRKDYDQLSSADKKAILEELVEFREMKEQGVHSCNLSAQRDATSTMDGIQKEITNLHTRTGIEVVVMCVRGDATQTHPSFSYTTSDRLNNFFELIFKAPMGDVLTQMEAFCISGLSGLAQKSAATTAALKKSAMDLIQEKWVKISGGTTRLTYINFPTITAETGIVVRGWPLLEFKAPSKITTRAEATVLYNAWLNETARFERLTHEEHVEWVKTNMPSSSSEATPDANANGKRPAGVITGIHGTAIEAPLKKRKQRVKKVSSTSTSTSTTPTATTTVPAATSAAPTTVSAAAPLATATPSGAAPPTAATPLTAAAPPAAIALTPAAAAAASLSPCTAPLPVVTPIVAAPLVSAGASVPASTAPVAPATTSSAAAAASTLLTGGMM
ncbi:hypothetical protein EIP91_009020 [Steccherinum ochraceum]|uniref:Uncharacterized protein n=1 Tax=Steccherinum ochraceum TaxID=92696 RepID=A0A4R0R4U3_9APHY|nr:hypothetical protein EIP91_009020 [Steccherinum ochraceum]